MINSTVDFYNKNAQEFYKNTVNVDMSEHYRRFEEYLLPESRILDAGCGSGRDSLYFLSKGYNVHAFDASVEMVKLSSELTGLPVQQAKFEDVKFDVMFNGIWASASLLHVDRGSIIDTLQKLAATLSEDGVLFMSFKYGDKVYEKDDRVFNCYDESSFSKLFSAIPMLTIFELYKTADVREERINEYWLSAIVKKG
ncbi:class I SAM-dependent methyltransferase [Desulfosporosinus nitroreducens]|uniref:Class I SAM-dependent methyltransferase n=1 Tax=Desulfosporosinus nitroreducens TaxID=2018668 RepID=A0ABT8QPD3_9FIRM|nr:class I SAM-dependent methyltransferase [Desulfosporosinus nitroreducens]MCO1603372.1 class I SAM-dependent methyltransferase [Desulfosporosinus nitroreducens]MDO0823212.1 class I SAM-dependent methyltransferase [Desulfosporosinus nitroreducens]